MNAEIITIGDEILIGQTIDTNSAWMGQQLNLVGVDIHAIHSVRDTPEAIVEALGMIHPQTKLVLLTGGLGPTKDDLTKHTLNDYFGGKLVYHEEVYQHIVKLFASMGRVPNEMNRGQAELPDVCQVLFNEVGTASGMRFQKNDTYYISMPGVPYEMKHLMEKHVLPWVVTDLMDAVIVHRTIMTQGLPESELAEKLESWESALPKPLKLAYLPSPGLVKLRITAKGIKGDEDRLKTLVDGEADKLNLLIGDSIYGEADMKLEEIVGQLLLSAKQTIATAESCTGGYIAHKITSIAGSSAYFNGSVVAYANEVKVKMLGVNEADILMHGAVSERVVRQMAEGIRKRMGTDWGIATSGIAGPDGGSAEKPVGTVWIAWAGPEGTTAQVFSFGKYRERNIKKATWMALDVLRKKILSRTFAA